ncbi:hypothetical protein ACNSOP_09240 [Aliarcobacter lanthieri]|uniref:hypothetical protein n=1 Tax=Aliarcobacter lanthieri TaxID=1355374 RepID=UPI003AA92908
MSAKKFNIPFGTLGDKVEIPTEAQVDGSISYAQGYPYGYELEYTDPNAKDINRAKLNQLFYDITNALREIQQNGVSEWSEDGKPYKINSLVYASDGTVKQNLINNNNNADTHSSWSTLINASTLTTALSNISSIPKGLISMWSGAISDIPTGWALCNGSNGTPDLRDRFVIGAGNSYNVGLTGGSKDAIVVAHTHKQDSHTHTATVKSAGAHTHNVGSSNGRADATQGSLKFAGNTNSRVSSSAGAHTHEITNSSVAPAIASTGQSGVNANLPPYYALAFIMKL